MDTNMLEIGKETTITNENFRNLIIILFGRLGDIEISRFNEEGKGISNSDMLLYHLKMSESEARDLFTKEELEEIQDDGELHIATWQDGKGWIVDYSMTRKLLVWAARIYDDIEPCLNCSIYRERVKAVGENNWANNETCQDCIVGNGWMNFVMDIDVL